MSGAVLSATASVLDALALPVRAYRIEASLDVPWALVLDVVLPRDGPPQALLGTAVTLESDEEARPLVLHGYVESLADTESVLQLTVRPALALLAHTGRHAIYQDRDVVETTSDILAEHRGAWRFGLDARLLEGHPKREYRTQWGESDLTFLTRMWAEEGITSWLEDATDGEERLVLSDDTRRREPDIELPYEPGAIAAMRARPQAPLAWRLEVLGHLRAQAVRFRSYDLVRPERLPEGVHSVGGGGLAVEPFEHRTELGEPALEAQRQAEAHGRDTQRLVLHGTTSLMPGTMVRLRGTTHHDGDWLVDRLTTVVRAAEDGSPTQRSHVMVCAAREHRVRPRPQPKPRVSGTLTATVVGDDHIDVDELGRVILRFPWDRRTSETRAVSRTTRRVRLAQPWAGPALGHMTLPRVGHEVLVAFLGGDPDEPIVVGSLHNGRNPPALQLPDHKTHSVWHSQSVPGGATYNEIRMVDDAGAEVLHLYAGLDLDTLTVRDHREDVGRDQLTNIGGSEKRVVRRGSSTSVGGGQRGYVGGDASYEWGGNVDASTGSLNLVTMGDFTQSTTGNYTVRAPSIWFGAETFEVVSNVNVIGKGAIELATGGATITMHDGEIVIAVGGSSITVNAAGIKLSAPIIQLNP